MRDVEKAFMLQLGGGGNLRKRRSRGEKISKAGVKFCRWRSDKEFCARDFQQILPCLKISHCWKIFATELWLDELSVFFGISVEGMD